METFKFEIVEPRYFQRIRERTVDTLKVLYAEGKTLEQLGYFFGVSRERIRQLLKDEGYSRKDGGQNARSLNKAALLKAKQLASRKKTEAKMEAVFKCPYEQLVAICGVPITYSNIQNAGSPQSGYYQQMRNALTRGIGWEITFPEWWRVWQESGHWDARGRGASNYCMSRERDEGPYRLGNVKIITNLDNTRSGQTKFLRKVKQRDELGLTVRERHIYDMMKAGFSSPIVIGRKLGLKANTVGQIKQGLKKRTGLFNGIQLKLK